MLRMKSCRNCISVCLGPLFVLVLLLGAQHQAWGEELDNNKTDHDKTFFEYLKGEPTDNQFFLGMATFHFTTSSREKDQWNNKLIGFQYKDFFACTFENSFYNQTWVAGIARNFSKTQLSDNWDMTFGYRLGGAYGYKGGEAPFSSSSSIIPVVEIYNQYYFQKHFGVELMITTSLSASLFYQF